MAETEEHQIPGERAETVTATRVDNNPVLKRGAVALAIVLFIGFALWSTSGNKTKDSNIETERVVIRQTTPFEAAREKTEPVEEKPVVKLPTPVLEDPMPQVDELLDAARRAPVMAYSGDRKIRPCEAKAGTAVMRCQMGILCQLMAILLARTSRMPTNSGSKTFCDRPDLRDRAPVCSEIAISSSPWVVRSLVCSKLHLPLISRALQAA